MTIRRTLAILVALMSLAAALLVNAQPAGAATFTVTRRDDPNPNGCRKNDCSLREAVIRSNNNPGPDTIILGNGRYFLRIAGRGENNSETGDLDIKRRVTIIGNGAGDTIVDANAFDRVLEIRGAAEKVVLKNLTVMGGEIDATGVDPVNPDGGGGILNHGSARLQNVVVTENGAPACCGGGIFNVGTLTVANSRVTSNTAADCCGGGILNADGRLKVRNSRIDHNRAADCCGGGLWNSHGGRVTIFKSMIDHNQAPACCGGGIFNTDVDSFIKINRSRVNDNNADECCGGGLYQDNSAKVLLVRSRFDQNTVDECCGGAIFNGGGTTLRSRRSVLDNNVGRGCCGGALYNGGGTAKLILTTIRDNRMHRACCGGGIYDIGDLTLRRSLVTRNRSTGDAGGFGGGLLLSSATSTTIESTTISRNFSSTTGGGIHFQGAGGLTLLNSTVSSNSSFGDGAGIHDIGPGPIDLTHATVVGNSTRGSGGGVFTNGGTFDVLRSIIANNQSDDCNAPLPGASGRNLDRDSTCFAGGSAIHANPRVLDLANNGGPTPTHALRANSPAVDAAGANACPPPPRDQRGVKRPKNGDGQGGARCDLGAYERKP